MHMTLAGERKVVEKVWGSETWVVNREYCGKKMLVYPGRRCSFHYHPVKDKTFLVIKGELLVRYVPVNQPGVLIGLGALEEACRRHFQVQILRPGDSFHVPTGMPHQFEALGHNIGPAEFLEFSSHHFDEDVVRVLRHDDPVFTQPSWEARHVAKQSARKEERKARGNVGA